MKKYCLGLQLYSVRSDLARDFEGTLRSVSEMGYEGVEFAGLYGKTPAEARELCRKYGLEPVSAHVPFSEMRGDPDGVFTAYSEIGCSYIAVPYLSAEDRPDSGNFDKTIGDVALLSEKAKRYGLVMMYHNHDFEFVRLANGRYGFDELYARVPGLCAEIDTCWVNVAGEDPAAYLRKYADRIPVVHFKDFVMPGKKAENLYNLIGMEETEKPDEGSFSFMPVGYGAQDVGGMVAALDGSTCRWIVVEQDEPSMKKSRLECARMSIGYLRSLGL